MKISLNIFTNSTLSAPRTDIIERTYKSFIDTFGDNYPVTVYCDPHPNYKQGKYYLEALEKLFPVVHKTDSLSDGYIKAVRNTDAEFCVMLEHDWQFNKPLIKHSLEEICKTMASHGLYHIRFNKRSNVISGWDIGLTEKHVPLRDFTWCETSVLSNNPHIIQVKPYREKCLPLLQIKPGSKGIEENLTHVGLVGAIYGGRDYPATVKHIDGRRSR
jgi:hypothetical protein